MPIPPEKARLLDEIAARVAQVPNVEAVALGGSHARGRHRPDSDLDIGIYYREATPFRVDDIRRIAEAYSASGAPTVTDFYDWGPFVNGGAWIDNAITKIDFLYRNLDQLEQMTGEAKRGEWRHNFDQQPPFGFRSVTTLAEIHICRPLHDPKNVLAPLKAEVALYPPALKARIIQDALWLSEFTFVHARNYAKAGDVPNTVGCMTRIFHYLVHTLFALNESYLANDKTVLQEVEGFAKKPEAFGARVSAILANAGENAKKLGVSLDRLEVLFLETAARAGGAYVPKFPTG